MFYLEQSPSRVFRKVCDMTEVNLTAHPDPRTCPYIQDIKQEGPVLKNMIEKHFGSSTAEKRELYKKLVDADLALRNDYDHRNMEEVSEEPVQKKSRKW